MWYCYYYFIDIDMSLERISNFLSENSWYFAEVDLFEKFYVDKF